MIPAWGVGARGFKSPPPHHSSIEMKQNHIRLTKGRDNYIGRNWEAVPEWFTDRFNRNNGDKSNGDHGKEPATEREKHHLMNLAYKEEVTLRRKSLTG